MRQSRMILVPKPFAKMHLLYSASVLVWRCICISDRHQTDEMKREKKATMVFLTSDMLLNLQWDLHLYNHHRCHPRHCCQVEYEHDHLEQDENKRIFFFYLCFQQGEKRERKREKKKKRITTCHSKSKDDVKLHAPQEVSCACIGEEVLILEFRGSVLINERKMSSRKIYFCYFWWRYSTRLNEFSYLQRLGITARVVRRTKKRQVIHVKLGESKEINVNQCTSAPMVFHSCLELKSQWLALTWNTIRWAILPDIRFGESDGIGCCRILADFICAQSLPFCR